MNFFKILKYKKAATEVEIFGFNNNKSRLNNNRKEKNKVQFNSIDYHSQRANYPIQQKFENFYHDYPNEISFYENLKWINTSTRDFQINVLHNVLKMTGFKKYSSKKFPDKQMKTERPDDIFKISYDRPN